MTSWNNAERLKRENAQLGRYSVHMSVVLSLILSLAAIVILSKKHVTNFLWVDVAAFAVPIPFALYFREQIVLFGAFAYVAVVVLTLSAAILFGI